MKQKRTIVIFLAGALAVAIAFGAVAYRSVYAATPKANSTTTYSTEIMGREGGRGPMGEYNREDLANALEITVDELNTAFESAHSIALTDAVAQGLITQAQADQLASSGKVFPFGNRWDGWLTQNGIEFITYLAEELGITVDELKAAYQTTTYANFDQAVADGSLTQEQADLMKGQYALRNDSTFQANMNSAYTDAVNQAVASGVITSAQAEQILSQNSGMFLSGMGELGGQGRPHGHGEDWMNDGTPPAQP